MASGGAYVTHDQTEAMTMGDRVAVLKDGILQQVDTPLALYDKPANLFVAGFIGSPAMNLIEAKAVDGEARIGDYALPVDRTTAARATGGVTLGVRPEAWRIVDADQGGLPVTITVVEELGADTYVYGASDAPGAPEQLVIRVDARRRHQRGQTMHITTDPEQVHVFDTYSGNRLSA